MVAIDSLAMAMLFDTHAHLISDDWDSWPPRPLHPTLPVPARTDYTVTAEALVRMMDEQQVATSCVVQRGHLYGYDNSYIIEAGRRFPDRLLPVVILDTQDPATPAALAQLRGVRGIRMANTRPSQLDTAWMASPAALQVWQTCATLNLPVAIIFFRNQLGLTLPLLRQIARQHAALPILIDHLGIAWGASLPELAWARESGIDTPLPPAPDYGIETIVQMFADTPNVHFKFTEINVERMQEGGVDPAQVLRRMADSFGAQRLVWGSDIGQSLKWPYPDKVRHAHEAAALLAADERAAFLHDNAARIYRAT
jgi:predicted TIM-barrel fold metal-dependent hydrolase